MRIAALMIGLLVAALGLVGALAPEVLLRLVSKIHLSPALYLAALLRVAFGIIFIVAAPSSRLPTALRILGVIVILAGVLTPFFGAQMAEVALNSGSKNPGMVRALAGAALAFGGFIVYATGHKRRAA
jgi:hypothetical protein